MGADEEIAKVVDERYRHLMTIGRDALNAHFNEKFGYTPHPRLPLSFLAKAISRRLQDELWIQKTGRIPDVIRRTSLAFYMTHDVPFMNREGIKGEKSQEVQRARTEKPYTERRVESSPAGMLTSRITLIQPDAIVAPIYKLIVDILKAHKGSMAYADLEKKFKKGGGDKSTSVSALLTMMQRSKVVRVEIEQRTVEETKFTVTEEKLPDPLTIIVGMDKKKGKRHALLGQPNFSTIGKTTHQVMEA